MLIKIKFKLQYTTKTSHAASKAYISS